MVLGIRYSFASADKLNVQQTQTRLLSADVTPSRTLEPAGRKQWDKDGLDWSITCCGDHGREAPDMQFDERSCRPGADVVVQFALMSRFSPLFQLACPRLMSHSRPAHQAPEFLWSCMFVYLTRH